MASFEKTRDSYFDVTAKDAVDVVLSDSIKDKDACEEDTKFIQRLRHNEPVHFGARDWVQQGCPGAATTKGRKASAGKI